MRFTPPNFNFTANFNLHPAVNDSPLGGREGTALTSSLISERLAKEALSNVALAISSAPPVDGMPDAIEVRGRGELQVSEAPCAERTENARCTA